MQRNEETEYTLTSILPSMQVHSWKYNSNGFIKSTNLRKKCLGINNDEFLQVKCKKGSLGVEISKVLQNWPY